jgi:hypothetical protein
LPCSRKTGDTSTCLATDDTSTQALSFVIFLVHGSTAARTRRGRAKQIFRHVRLAALAHWRDGIAQSRMDARPPPVALAKPQGLPPDRRIVRELAPALGTRVTGRLRVTDVDFVPRW